MSFAWGLLVLRRTTRTSTKRGTGEGNKELAERNEERRRKGGVSRGKEELAEEWMI